jgi:hypothetical protein
MSLLDVKSYFLSHYWTYHDNSVNVNLRKSEINPGETYLSNGTNIFCVFIYTFPELNMCCSSFFRVKVWSFIHESFSAILLIPSYPNMHVWFLRGFLLSYIIELGKSFIYPTFDSLLIFILNLQYSVDAPKGTSNAPCWYFWYSLQYILDWKVSQLGAQQETDGSHK